MPRDGVEVLELLVEEVVADRSNFRWGYDDVVVVPANGRAEVVLLPIVVEAASRQEMLERRHELDQHLVGVANQERALRIDRNLGQLRQDIGVNQARHWPKPRTMAQKHKGRLAAARFVEGRDAI